MQTRQIIGAVFTLAATAAIARGQSYKDDIGYTRLQTEQGAATPNGANVPVTQIEAALTTGGNNYFPDTTNSEFSGKTITPRTTPDSTSSHATQVGSYFYGNFSSLAPGITSVNAYLADNWIGSQFLNTGTSSSPGSTLDRVANHSYVGSLSTNAQTLEALHRFDYVIQQDDYINVIAVNNPSNGGPQPLWSSSFNAISVGLTNGQAASESPDLGDGLYVAGRAAPDVVAPTSATSFATPLVSSTAATLVQYAHNNASTLHESSFVSPRTGLTLQYGETADVIKAAIMAGADRVTSNTSTTDQITGYGTGPQTQNGLDSRYGAGQLDIYNSFHVINGGQHAPGAIGTYGFDYNPSSASAAVENYTFSGQYGIAATLAWNLHVAGNTSASLANYQLHLYQLLAGGGSLSIAVSSSTIDNTQNIFSTGLNVANTYELQVTRTDNLGNWDYGLAWDLAPVPEPGVAAIWVFGMVVAARRCRSNPNPKFRNREQLAMPR